MTGSCLNLIGDSEDSFLVTKLIYVYYFSATDVVTVYVFQEPSLLSSLQDNGLTDVVLHALLIKDVRLILHFFRLSTLNSDVLGDIWFILSQTFWNMSINFYVSFQFYPNEHLIKISLKYLSFISKLLLPEC